MFPNWGGSYILQRNKKLSNFLFKLENWQKRGRNFSLFYISQKGELSNSLPQELGFLGFGEFGKKGMDKGPLEVFLGEGIFLGDIKVGLLKL